MSESTDNGRERFDLDTAARQGWRAIGPAANTVEIEAGPSEDGRYMVMDSAGRRRVVDHHDLRNLPTESEPEPEPVERVAVILQPDSVKRLRAGGQVDAPVFPDTHHGFTSIPLNGGRRLELPLTPDGEGEGDWSAESELIALGAKKQDGEWLYPFYHADGSREWMEMNDWMLKRKQWATEREECRRHLRGLQDEVKQTRRALGAADDEDTAAAAERVRGERDEAQTLVKHLRETCPDFAKELDRGHDLITMHDGFFTSFDEFFSHMKRAWPDGKVPSYAEHPFELLMQLIDERDDLRQRAERAEAENQRLRTQPRPDVLRAPNGEPVEVIVGPSHTEELRCEGSALVNLWAPWNGGPHNRYHLTPSTPSPGTDTAEGFDVIGRDADGTPIRTGDEPAMDADQAMAAMKAEDGECGECERLRTLIFRIWWAAEGPQRSERGEELGNELEAVKSLRSDRDAHKAEAERLREQVENLKNEVSMGWKFRKRQKDLLFRKLREVRSERREANERAKQAEKERDRLSMEAEAEYQERCRLEAGMEQVEEQAERAEAQAERLRQDPPPQLTADDQTAILDMADCTARDIGKDTGYAKDSIKDVMRWAVEYYRAHRFPAPADAERCGECDRCYKIESLRYELQLARNKLNIAERSAVQSRRDRDRLAEQVEQLAGEKSGFSQAMRDVRQRAERAEAAADRLREEIRKTLCQLLPGQYVEPDVDAATTLLSDAINAGPTPPVLTPQPNEDELWQMGLYISPPVMHRKWLLKHDSRPDRIGEYDTHDEALAAARQHAKGGE